ncbi:hypothetical protein BYT27DRAFT_7067926, partial [Phlegmacium glaucopus]
IPKSPLRHLLKSNVAPSDFEIITIRALITDAEIRLEELHHQCPTSDRTFQATKSRLLEFIEAHKALLSPVRYLPTEILHEIFLQVRYADHDSCTHPSLTSTIVIPWRLGHISHRWREVALSIPSLWDTI